MDKHGARLSEKASGRKIGELDRDDLLILYKHQSQEQVAAWTREDLEKELVQFYMTQAYGFKLQKLRWMVAVGKAIRNLESWGKSALHD